MNNYVSLYYPRDRIKVLLLLLGVGLIYTPFLNNPLVFDDVPFFKYPIITFADAPFNFSLRWFSYTTFGVTWAFFGEAPFIFRVQNLLLHAVNVLLMLLVLRLWISLFVTGPAREKMANWGAWLGALVFACHPLSVYGTGYLIERSILMATLFTLLLHLAYFRGLLEGDRRYAALAVAAYFLAVFSKEQSLMAPAILLPMSWVLRARIKLPRPALLMTWFGFFVIALIAVMRAKGMGVFGQTFEKDAVDLFGQEEMLKGLPQLSLLSALTQAGLFFKYCLLMLTPNPAWMSIDMREIFILTWRDWTSWIGMFAFVGFGIVALICLLRGGRITLIGIAMLYPWLFYLPEFSTIRVQEIFVLYRSYLWLPGFILFLPLLVSALPDKKIIWAGAIAVILLVPLSWNRLWVFADNYRLWDDAVQLLHGENRIGAQRTYYSRGYYAAKDRGDWSAAIDDYKKSLQVSSAFPPVRIALAGAYANAGRFQEALIEYDRAIELYPKNAQIYYSKALFLKKMRDETGAMAAMQQSCDLGYGMACAMVNIKKSAKH